MTIKELTKKLNIEIDMDDLKKEIKKNDKYLKYLNQELTLHQKQAIALVTMQGRPIEELTLRKERSLYQIGCNLGKAVIVRYFYE